MPKQPAISSFFRPINESVPLELTRNEPGSDSEWSDITDNDQELLDSDDEDVIYPRFDQELQRRKIFDGSQMS